MIFQNGIFLKMTLQMLKPVVQEIKVVDVLLMWEILGF